jgi:hypothetical protein
MGGEDVYYTQLDEDGNYIPYREGQAGYGVLSGALNPQPANGPAANGPASRFKKVHQACRYCGGLFNTNWIRVHETGSCPARPR